MGPHTQDEEAIGAHKVWRQCLGQSYFLDFSSLCAGSVWTEKERQRHALGLFTDQIRTHQKDRPSTVAQELLSGGKAGALGDTHVLRK